MSSTKPELVVGAPVSGREWAMPSWFDHVEEAAQELGMAPHYVFVADPTDPTVQIIQERCTYQDRAFTISPVSQRGPEKRTWNPARYQVMVQLRNQLLQEVRFLQPDWFLSIDSDILIHPKCLSALVDDTSRFDAIGGATWMTPYDTHIPNCGWVNGMSGVIRRPMEHVGVFNVGVIMALKLMTPKAYAIDYEMYLDGEDIGWSIACARAGLKLGWDNRYPSKHLMSPEALGRVDERCGF